MSRDFRKHVLLKGFDLGLKMNEQAKTVLQTFSFLRRYSMAKFKNCVASLTTRTRTFSFRYGVFYVLKLVFEFELEFDHNAESDSALC